MLLRMSIPGRSVIEQNMDDCAVVFRQKAHRTCEQDLQRNTGFEQCNFSAVGKFVFGLLAVGNLLDVGNKFL